MVCKSKKWEHSDFLSDISIEGRSSCKEMKLRKFQSINWVYREIQTAPEYSLQNVKWWKCDSWIRLCSKMEGKITEFNQWLRAEKDFQRLWNGHVLQASAKQNFNIQRWNVFRREKSKDRVTVMECCNMDGSEKNR